MLTSLVKWGVQMEYNLIVCVCVCVCVCVFFPNINHGYMIYVLRKKNGFLSYEFFKSGLYMVLL